MSSLIPATDYPLIFLRALLSAGNYIPVVSYALCHSVRMQIPMTLLLIPHVPYETDFLKYFKVLF